MRDKVNRNTVIADENINSLPSGHPATDKFELWATEIHDRTNLDDGEDGSRCCEKPMSEAERQKRMDEMDEVIREDINRT